MTGKMEIAPALDLATLIRSIRGQRVILDADLARIYAVPTKRLNEQYRRNTNRFPEDFAFQLSAKEWTTLSSQVPASQANLDLKSQIATSSFTHGGRRKLPIAFTEHGALMVANILNSPRAAAMSIYVIRAFVKMREDLAANAAILKRLAEIDESLLLHDTALRDIYQKLRPLLAPESPPPRPEIGFHVKEDAAPYRTKSKSTYRR
jgi:ORF6N domain